MGSLNVSLDSTLLHGQSQGHQGDAVTLSGCHGSVTAILVLLLHQISTLSKLPVVRTRILSVFGLAFL